MVVNAPADERFCLRIRNLPAVLSTEAITSLISHYGSTRVRVLQRRNAASSGKEPGAAPSKQLQKAVAIFATREAQQNARRRLHSLVLAGQHLQVEVVGDEAATASTETRPQPVQTGDELPLKGQPPLPKGLPPPLPPTPTPMQNLLYAPAPLAPHLGLHYAPSPLLEYKYPKATEGIVRNIANALIALPRFYIQVLHLMNKMNLPPPFDEDAIPGRFSTHRDVTPHYCESEGIRKRTLKRRRSNESSNEQIVEEDEEDDSEEGGNDAVKSMDHNNTLGTEEVHLPSSRLQSGRVTEDSKSVQKSSEASIQPEANSSRPVLLGMPFSKQNRGPETKKSAALNVAFQLGTDTGNTPRSRRLTRPGVISENEVKRQRLAQGDFQKEPLMATYSRGSPSAVVVVENIAQTVDEKDLRYVFGYVLPLEEALTSLKIRLRPGKGSAVITYPDEAVAVAAVDELHGVQLEGKALLVSFQSTSGVSEVMPSVRHWTIEELASNRLHESQLALEKSTKTYQRGEPSDTLYVKNLAKAVELADLCAVFGAVLPPESGPDTLNIRHFTTGRMKCQAFVKYSTVELASSALNQVHGVVLKDKPMIVCFRKPQTN
ncbi:RNA-binding region-containing protein 3 [Phytophthora ramorum]|uniref:RNA-binding region-containing protein 3 n=1 Tax=Phytophthora ramorum TaxID=164328 RepID=UPI0030B18FC8|nr:RNA-binding region-containing protein 3 [Phytophthora ramorum]